MKIADLASVFNGPDRVRILKDGAEIYAGYWGSFIYCTDYEKVQNEEIKRLGLTTEIYHRKYKELGLNAPVHPTETPHYQFSDLNLEIWQTVRI
jgi:hypothetical protein